MTLRILKISLTSLIIAINSLINVANAGLINMDIGTDDNAAFSFDNEGYSLKWLDFGTVTATDYLDLNSLTGAGGQYEGWRLAKQSEATELWELLFFSQVAGESINSDGDLDYSSTDSNVVGQLINNYSAITGTSSYNDWDNAILGWYLAENGTVDYVLAGNRANESWIHQRESSDYSSYDSLSTYTHQQLLLVQDIASTEVPEPMTFALFSLGIFCLATRRLKLH